MPPAATAAISGRAIAAAEPRDFVTLMKPRVMALVVFSGLAGMMAAPGALHPVLAAVATLCIAAGSGGAAAINMWWDRDIDALMARTRARPLPDGRMAPEEALTFGVVLVAGAVMLMGLALNWMAAGLLLFASLFYAVVYTMWLKRRTAQNIVIGGAAGAFPPVIGWAAVTGGVDAGALALFALIFFWTPPHFWALSLYNHADYSRAGVPMLPVVAGDAATRRQILLYTVVLAPVSLLPVWTGTAGWLYGAAAATGSAVFIALAGAVMADRTARWARITFRYSIAYLFVLLAFLIVEHLARG